jgi:hypothetical protein
MAHEPLNSLARLPERGCTVVTIVLRARMTIIDFLGLLDFSDCGSGERSLGSFEIVVDR